MKTLLFFIFGCVCLLHDVIAIQMDIANDETTTTIVEKPRYCKTTGISCYDCHTLQYCFGHDEASLQFTVDCKIQNDRRPYCDANKVECVSDDICGRETILQEKCNQNGIRPDPKNCSRFIQCAPTNDNKGYMGSIVECPTGTKYSVSSGQCLSNAECTTIDQYCNGKAGKLVQYKPYPSIYAKCPAANTSAEIVVEFCKSNYTFNEEFGSCRPICKKTGYIASDDNCEAYYYCVQKDSYSDYLMTLNLCPTGSGFNPYTKLCDQNYAACKSSSPLFERRKRNVYPFSDFKKKT